MKPILLLDIDGVCADFTELAIRLCRERLDVHGAESMITQWDTLTALGVTDRASRDKVNDGIREQGSCAGMLAYPGARIGVLVLGQIYDITPCTAPFPGSKHWHYEREDWVTAHLGIKQSKVIFCHEKGKIDGHILVDDKPENIAEWSAAHPDGLPVLFERPWNAKTTVELPKNLRRVSTWSQLVELLQEYHEEHLRYRADVHE